MELVRLKGYVLWEEVDNIKDKNRAKEEVIKERYNVENGNWKKWIKEVSGRRLKYKRKR